MHTTIVREFFFPPKIDSFYHYLASAINDTFKSEQGLQSLAFFLIAILIGIFFLFPLMQISPTGQTGSISWPSLSQLTSLVQRARRVARRPDETSEAESDEFERILSNTDESEDEDEQQIRLRRLFGKSRSKFFPNHV